MILSSIDRLLQETYAALQSAGILRPGYLNSRRLEAAEPAGWKPALRARSARSAHPIPHQQGEIGRGFSGGAGVGERGGGGAGRLRAGRAGPFQAGGLDEGRARLVLASVAGARKLSEELVDTSL